MRISQGMYKCLAYLRRQSLELEQIPAEGIAVGSVDGGGRDNAGQCIVHGGGYGIDIRPASGLAAGGILLQGTETTLGHLHGGFAGIEI